MYKLLLIAFFLGVISTAAMAQLLPHVPLFTDMITPGGTISNPAAAPGMVPPAQSR